jgi:hypothetical protein
LGLGSWPGGPEGACSARLTAELSQCLILERIAAVEFIIQALDNNYQSLIED